MINKLMPNIFNALVNLSDVIWCIDIEKFDLVYINDSCINVWGYTALEIIEKKDLLFNSILPEDKESFYKGIRKAIDNGAYKSEFRIRSKDEKIKYLKAHLLYNKEGEQKIITCICCNITTIKAAEVEMKKMAKDNLSILENIRDSFVTLDNSGTIVFANRAFEKFIRKSKNKLIGKIIWDIFPELKGLLFEKNYYKTQKEKISIEFEEFLPTLNKWLFVSAYPTSEGMSVFIHDVTSCKIRREQLIDSEKKFHLISDNSPMFIWTVNEKLERTFFNKTFINFSGLSFEELIEIDWISLVHPDDLQKVTIGMHRGLIYKAEINFEFRMRRHDGEYRWIKMNGIPQIDNLGIFQGFLGNGVDITDLKYYYKQLEEKNIELEEALNESRRLSGILNKTSNILVLTDVNGCITWVNQAFTKITEYTLEEACGKKPGPLVYGPETSIETMEILHEAIKTREITRVEILNYSKSGRKFWVDLKIEPIFKNGEPEGYMAIEMDITKRKIDEIAIKQKNEKIKQFSFITSHDLRHEFSKIMLLFNLGKSAQNTIEDFRSLFNHIEAPLNKINYIISEINSNLNIQETGKTLNDKLQEIDEIKEICLIDDDQLTNLIHKQIITMFMPHTPIRVFESVEPAINYLKIQPYSNRIIFLDLNFPTEKSGWDFLDEYHISELNAPIIILSSSIDNEDIDRTKQYKSVLEYFSKPLTVEILNKYMKK